MALNMRMNSPISRPSKSWRRWWWMRFNRWNYIGGIIIYIYVRWCMVYSFCWLHVPAFYPHVMLENFPALDRYMALARCQLNNDPYWRVADPERFGFAGDTMVIGAPYSKLWRLWPSLYHDPNIPQLEHQGHVGTRWKNHGKPHAAIGHPKTRNTVRKHRMKKRFMYRTTQCELQFQWIDLRELFTGLARVFER